MEAETGLISGSEPAQPIPNYVLLFKGVSESANLYGGGLIIFNHAQNAVKQFMVGFGTDKRLKEISLARDPHSFEDFIITEKMHGRIAMKISQELTATLRDDLENPDSEIMQALRNGNAGQAQVYLTNLLSRQLGSTDIVVTVRDDAATEPAPAVAPAKTDAEIIQEVYQGVNRDAPASTDVFINVKFVLSPVKGVPVKNLQIGSSVMVSLSDERDLAKYLANLIQKASGAGNDKLVAVVTAVDLTDAENARVTLRFGPGIFGLARCSPDIMVKIVSENEPASDPTAASAVPSPELKINPLFYVAGVVFVIFIIILIIIRL